MIDVGSMHKLFQRYGINQCISQVLVNIKKGQVLLAVSSIDGSSNLNNGNDADAISDDSEDLDKNKVLTDIHIYETVTDTSKLV